MTTYVYVCNIDQHPKGKIGIISTYVQLVQAVHSGVREAYYYYYYYCAFAIITYVGFYQFRNNRMTTDFVYVPICLSSLYV